MKIKMVLLLLISFTFVEAYSICSEYNQNVNKVVGKSPAVNMMIQTLKNYQFPEKISKKDSIFKKISSVESLAQKKIDLIILWNSSGDYIKLAKKLKKVNVDMCSIKIDSIWDYIDEYKALGKILNEEQRGEELSSYLKNKLNSFKQISGKIPEDKKLSVYYARSQDGLQTECKNSFHSEVIDIIGAKNPVECPKISGKTRVQINYEKLLILNPDVIVVKDKSFYNELLNKRKYSFLEAVKTKSIYIIPKKPISWFDNPPSFFKILGAFWLAKKIYPEYYNYDFNKEKEVFETLFLNTRIKD